MKQIIIDTNFLLIPFQFRVDIFSEIDRLMHEPYILCILEGTIDELNKIQEKQSGKDKKAAAMALKLIASKKVKHLKTEKNLNIDKLIVEQAKNPDCIVATQDMALKRVLKRNNCHLIILRKKQYLELI